MEGRSEPQSLTPDPVDPLDPEAFLRDNSKLRALGMKAMNMKNVIPEYATLQAFLLLLFSKCQHSNDFTTCCKQSQKTRYCHQKIMFLAATDLKMIRKHYEFIFVL